jgi:adhesin/invasin
MLSVFDRRSMRLAALAALLTGLTACDTVPLTAPSGSSITMSASTRVLPVGGSTVVSAFVTESGGTPVQNGTTVRFSTTLGRLDPFEAQTRNGVAETTFLAGDISGLAEIRAASGGAGGGTGTGTGTGNGDGTAAPSGGNVVQILVGAAAVEAVTVSASPTTVPASGGTTTIAASAVDAAGNRLANVPVTFSTTAGSLSATNAMTDASGDARVTLTTSREATVTARAADQTATVTITVAGVSTVSLAVDPSSPVAGQPMTLTVTPSVATGNPPPRVVVDWGDGTTTDLGIVPGARGVTHTYATQGFFTITVTATTDGESFTTQQAVQVIAQPTLGVSVSVTDTTPAQGIAVTFTASVTGTSSGQVTSYDWQILDAMGNLEAQQTTTSNQLQWTFSAPAGNRTVRVTVTTADNRTASGQITVAVQ